MTELNLYMFIVNICVAVICGGLLPIIPVLTRKSYLFGIKIPPAEQSGPEARQMKRRYVAVCLTGAVLILALCAAQYIVAPEYTLLTALYVPFLFGFIMMAAFIPNWKKAARLKEERRWTVPNVSFADTGSSNSRGKLSDLPWGWYVAGLLLIIVSMAITFVKYPSLPDRIPTHWGADMQPDAWSDKSLGTVLMLPLVNLGTLAVIWLCGIMFVKAKLQIDPQNPALSFAQHRLYRKYMGHGLGVLGFTLAVVMSWLGLLPVWPDITAPLWVIMSLILIPSAVLTVISVRSGQGGCKLKPKFTEEPDRLSVTAGAPGRGDDSYWKLGMFYYNPDDPANIVEDRFGNNLGFNYARTPVQFGAGMLLLALIGTYVWITSWAISLL